MGSTEREAEDSVVGKEEKKTTRIELTEGEYDCLCRMAHRERRTVSAQAAHIVATYCLSMNKATISDSVCTLYGKNGEVARQSSAETLLTGFSHSGLQLQEDYESLREPRKNID